MKAAKDLIKEHDAILLTLNILQEINERFSKKSQIDLNHIQKIIEILRIFADKCHHAKEEKFLLPAMQAAKIENIDRITHFILSEHAKGRKFVKNLSKAIERYAKNLPKAKNDFLNNSRAYVLLLRVHIDKENNKLFPLADKYLSQDTDKQLVHNFAKIEKEIIGKGIHERFHRTLKKLSKIYIS